MLYSCHPLTCQEHSASLPLSRGHHRLVREKATSMHSVRQSQAYVTTIGNDYPRYRLITPELIHSQDPEYKGQTQDQTNKRARCLPTFFVPLFSASQCPALHPALPCGAHAQSFPHLARVWQCPAIPSKDPAMGRTQNSLTILYCTLTSTAKPTYSATPILLACYVLPSVLLHPIPLSHHAPPKYLQPVPQYLACSSP